MTPRSQYERWKQATFAKSQRQLDTVFEEERFGIEQRRTLSREIPDWLHRTLTVLEKAGYRVTQYRLDYAKIAALQFGDHKNGKKGRRLPHSAVTRFNRVAETCRLADAQRSPLLEEIRRERSKTLLNEGVFSTQDFKNDHWFKSRNLAALLELLETAVHGSDKAAAIKGTMDEYIGRTIDGFSSKAGEPRFEEGKVKTRAAVYLRKPGKDREELRGVTDIIRCRVIFSDLMTLEGFLNFIRARADINIPDLGQSEYDSPRLVKISNYYGFHEGKHSKGFRGVCLSFAVNETDAFEVQLLTYRSSIVSRLDHPFVISNDCKLPDQEFDYLQELNQLHYKAAMLDVVEGYLPWIRLCERRTIGLKS